MIEKQKMAYLDAESEAGKRLAEWTAAEADGPLREEIALIKFQLAEACRNGSASLVRDLTTCLNQLEKTRTAQRLAMGHLYTGEQIAEFREQFFDAVVAELKLHFDADEWEPIVDSIADRYGEIYEATRRKAAKNAPRIGVGE